MRTLNKEELKDVNGGFWGWHHYAKHKTHNHKTHNYHHKHKRSWAKKAWEWSCCWCK